MGKGVSLLFLRLFLLHLFTAGMVAAGKDQPRTSAATKKRSQREAFDPNTSLQKALTPERPGGNLACYSCKLDFRKKSYEMKHPCLGRHDNLTVSEDYAVTCGPNDTSCRAERTEVNGVLIMLRRECTDICYPGCRMRGFGINNEVCEMCCDEDKCNHDYPNRDNCERTRKCCADGNVTMKSCIACRSGQGGCFPNVGVVLVLSLVVSGWQWR